MARELTLPVGSVHVDLEGEGDGFPDPEAAEEPDEPVEKEDMSWLGLNDVNQVAGRECQR